MTFVLRLRKNRSHDVRSVGIRLNVLSNHVQRFDGRDGEILYSVQGDASLHPRLVAMDDVDVLHHFSGAYGLVTRGFRQEPTEIQIGNVRIGGRSVLVIAGPCGVESRPQVHLVAKAIRESGAHALRGGAFKPRTSPYAFQGLGRAGLEILAETRALTGLPVVTEVMTAEDVPLVAEYADVLQIGARNMQNFRLLEACGMARRPVLLKRGMSATVDEFLAAAEYIYLRGNHEIILCERGVKGYEPRTRNMLDLASAVLLKQLTHLPVIVDPSHATGLRELVPDLARATVAAGLDGLMIEVHGDPENALSDGRQSLRPEDFAEMMVSLDRVAKAIGRNLALNPGPATSAQ